MVIVPYALHYLLDRTCDLGRVVLPRLMTESPGADILLLFYGTSSNIPFMHRFTPKVKAHFVVP
jgi:hypothetical protein